jgi:hypothetical protein
MPGELDPIYGAFSNPPPELPLGYPIADKVSVEQVDQRVARAVYEKHHSYLPNNRVGCHYGIFLQNEIVGSITFSAWPSGGTVRGYDSENVREVSRVCVGHDTPNLASCAMAKAQDDYIEARGAEFEVLVTYVHEDWSGSMFAALNGKGWERDGVSLGNGRPTCPWQDVRDIDEVDKERWVCEL